MRFERVPFDDFRKCFDNSREGFNIACEAYEHIKLPQRGTPGSAGYDFYLPMNICLSALPTDNVFPTGVRVWLDPGYFLMCVPRSGLGFKYGIRLKNVTGVIDEDFIKGDTNGHIMVNLVTDIPVSLRMGERFMQGILVKYGVTEDDCPMFNKRVGGIGSTGG